MLGVVAAIAVVVLIMVPELAALGFLFDPVLLDVAIMLFATQFLLFGGQIRSFLAATRTAFVRVLRVVKLKH